MPQGLYELLSHYMEYQLLMSVFGGEGMMIQDFSPASVPSLQGYLVFIIGLFELSHKTFIFVYIHNGISKMNQADSMLPSYL